VVALGVVALGVVVPGVELSITVTGAT